MEVYRYLWIVVYLLMVVVTEHVQSLQSPPRTCESLNSNCYYLVQTKLNQSEACSYCQNNYGAKLASIPDQVVNDFLTNAWKNNWKGEKGSYGTRIWTIHQKSIDSLNYTNWMPNEPNGHNSEQCVEVRLFDGKWNDENCNSKRIFVCEKHQARNTTTTTISTTTAKTTPTTTTTTTKTSTKSTTSKKITTATTQQTTSTTTQSTTTTTTPSTTSMTKPPTTSTTTRTTTSTVTVSTSTSTTGSTTKNTTGSNPSTTATTINWIATYRREFHVNINSSNYTTAQGRCRSLNASLVSFTNPLQYLNLNKTLNPHHKTTYWVGVVVRRPLCVFLMVNNSEGNSIHIGNCSEARQSICSRAANISDILNDPVFVKMIEEMTIDAKNTGRARRQRKSIWDGRRSAMTIGQCGIFVLAAVVTVIVICDLPRLIHFWTHTIRKKEVASKIKRVSKKNLKNNIKKNLKKKMRVVRRGQKISNTTV